MAKSAELATPPRRAEPPRSRSRHFRNTHAQRPARGLAAVARRQRVVSQAVGPARRICRSGGGDHRHPDTDRRDDQAGEGPPAPHLRCCSCVPASPNSAGMSSRTLSSATTGRRMSAFDGDRPICSFSIGALDQSFPFALIVSQFSHKKPKAACPDVHGIAQRGEAV